MTKRLTLFLVALVVLVMPLQSLAMYNYDNPGDTNYIVYYDGAYDQDANPRNAADVTFTSDAITVDGMLDDAYASAPASPIANTKVLGTHDYAVDADAAAATGTLHMLWDGPLLYLLVEVNDATPVFVPADPESDGVMGNPAVPKDRDSVTFGFDVFNQKVFYETDTAGAFTIDSTGNLFFYRNAGIPSLGSVMADPIHPEYLNRIHSYAAVATETGYNVEIALQIEGTGLANGKQFGLEVEINNAQTLVARTVEEPNPNWWEPNPTIEVSYDEGAGRSSNTFWSHQQDDLYAEINHERPVAVDWGDITLAGWNGEDFAFSNWRLTNSLDYLSSIRFPKGVWREDTQTVLDNAVASAQALIDENSTDSAAVTAAADVLDAAIAGMRWADTTYPDPMDLPQQFTLPSPYQFFQSDRVVENADDWAARRDEILDMAQFYEYGYKPAAPDSMTIDVRYTAEDEPTMAWNGPVAPSTYVIDATMTYGDVSKMMSIPVYVPTEEQLAGRTSIPVVLSFNGNIEAYLNAGIAVAAVPAVTGGDGRSNEYAWGERTGIFYELFPYSRDGEAALNEVSSEMASAWAASRTIDALEMLPAYTQLVNGVDVSSLMDPGKLAVTGFSISGKYAFVSAVFDDRIDVCIPGAAGATGPSPWRYIYAGQTYDWSDTVWAPDGAAQQEAFGTEFIANSIRHNRVREVELFRHFLTPFNFYAKLDGAYGYAARLPFDQTDLVATLAPRAIVLESTLNDYNDGSVTDGLALDLAKSVYTNLGLDADDLIKYNYRTVQPTGDPHGVDDATHARNAEYVNYFFYGTEMSDATAQWLATNPYTLPVSNDKTQNPYDFYWGGYSTITGGSEGNADGWYNYTFSK